MNKQAPKRLPPLNSLRAFEAAARHLSFTRASEELFVTQAAISHQIKHLEEFLGLKLFHRENRTLRLTTEGAQYWPEINSILEQIKGATDALYTSEASGHLTVSVPPTFAIEWLIPRLAEFRDAYPDIELNVSAQAEEKEIDFYGEGVDAAIYYSTGPYKKGVFAARLLNEYLIPVCSPQLINGEHPIRKPDDLKHHRLLHEASYRDWRRWLEMVDVEGIELAQGTTYTHTVMVMQAAIHSQGVAVVHSILAQGELDSGRLIRPFDLPLETARAYDFACPVGNETKPKVAAFRSWLKQTLEEECAHDPLREGRKHILTVG